MTAENQVVETADENITETAAVDTAEQPTEESVVETADANAGEGDADIELPEDLSDNELNKLEQLVATRKREQRSKTRDSDLATIKSLMAKHGFTTKDVRVPRATTGNKVAPKYRNPADPSQTWTGRGKAPAWIAPYAKEDREQFAIPAA